jgi:nucleoside-diphosphate-sugar epimerase
MRVFLTGATGYVGSAVADELVAAGHEVVGLARSPRSAERLTARGLRVHRGDLEDLAALRAGAEQADAVVHTAFENISATRSIQDSTAADRVAVAAMGDALAGTGKPMVVTSVTSLLRPGAEGTEHDEAASDGNPRGRAEIDALALAERGVRVSAVRLPPSVHGEGDDGWVPALLRIARRQGFSGYVGEGANRWPAVHRLDAASLFRLALERADAGARWHAVADEGVPMRDIATAIGDVVGVPPRAVDADAVEEHFGFLARFVAMDSPRSSLHTRRALGWEPVRPGLLADIASGSYSA